MMSVHFEPLRPPASLASSSFGMPVRRDFLVPSVFLRSLDCFDCAKQRIDSRTPQLSASLKNLSDGWHFEPKADCFSVMFSLVCESKAGFSMRQLMKTRSCPLTWFGLSTFSSPLCFFLRCSRTRSTTWSATWLTCVPPLLVAIELTKETCANPSSDAATATSHRSPTFSKTRGTASAACLGPRKRSTYDLKSATGSFFPFRYTLTDECVQPAMSYARRSISATMSSSMADMPNLARSGTQLILVKSSLAAALISGLDCAVMLSLHFILKRLPSAESEVSTTNSDEKMLASLAP
mmetsp:Transcript_14287/g.45777  ORF Transcript_14287/g.45777 Transcript_14287/m.45777 type:complete len:294 (-) Transcript_14287:471-1352(-)